MSQVLRAQVASDAKCPDVVVKKASPYAPGYQENQYTVRGCGLERVYTCRNEGLVKYGSADCTYAAPAQPAAAAPAPEPAPGSEPSDGPEPGDSLEAGGPSS